MKQGIISLILWYQKNAPKTLRDSCRFEPSCSAYMIMAVNKYGSVKGCFLGLKRLLRCRYPNGGRDYP
jgi:putative membrane protein insertion efficiency factor